MATLEMERGTGRAGAGAASGRAVRLASAVAVVAAAAYVVCAVLNFAVPDLLPWIAQSWAHSLSLEPLRPQAISFDPGRLLVGLFTFTGFAWLVAYASAWLYNTWSRS